MSLKFPAVTTASVIALVCCASSSAAPFPVSTFETDLEGWTQVDLPLNLDVANILDLDNVGNGSLVETIPGEPRSIRPFPADGNGPRRTLIKPGVTGAGTPLPLFHSLDAGVDHPGEPPVNAQGHIGFAISPDPPIDSLQGEEATGDRWEWFSAPAKFLGDMSAADAFMYDIYPDGVDNTNGAAPGEFYPQLIFIGDGAGASNNGVIDSGDSLAFFTLNGGNDDLVPGMWNTIMASLDVTDTSVGLWHTVYNALNPLAAPGAPVSQAFLDAILADLLGIFIQGDHITLDNDDGLDNVKFVGDEPPPNGGVIPEPASLALLLVGAPALLAGLRRRRRE